jgi:hypothetical protein
MVRVKNDGVQTRRGYGEEGRIQRGKAKGPVEW